MARRHNKRQKKQQLQSPTSTSWLTKLYLDTRVAIVAIALAVIAINHLGAINWALDFLGRGFIAEANAAYLHKSKLEIGANILILAGLDTSLEVLKSSSAGVSFFVDIEVQVGNIVATLQELANKALLISLAAAGSLVGIELALQLAEILAVPTLTVTIIALAIHYVTRIHWRWAADISGKISQVLVLVTLLAHIGLPLVIYVSSLASAKLTAPLAQQVHSQFTETHADFSSIKQKHQESRQGKDGDHDKKSSEEKSDKKFKEIKPHVRSVIDKYKATSSGKTHKQTRSFSGSVVRHAIAVFLNGYIFPALLLIIFIWASRVVVSRSLMIEKLIEGSEPSSTGSVTPGKPKSRSRTRLRR